MSTPTGRNSWEMVEELVQTRDVEGLQKFIESLQPAQIVLAISRLTPQRQQALLNLMAPEAAADLIEDLPDSQAAELLEQLTPTQVAAIVEEMPSADRVDILSNLDEDEIAAILERMSSDEASETRELLEYPEHTAGGLMITEFVAVPDTFTVRDLLDNLRRNRQRYLDYEVQYVYVVSPDKHLKGVLRLRDLVLAPEEAPLTSLMIEKPLQIGVQDNLEQLTETFRDHAFVAVPAVDDRERLVGVVRRVSVEEASTDVANQSFLKVSGIVGGEEHRGMPLRRRSIRRLSWLSVNILLNIMAASVIAFYQDTLSAAIALAVFLPIISDMSGCSGNQAVAVSIRELTLGLVRPRDVVRVLGKEATLGLVNGCVLGLMLGCATFLWKGNPYLGLVAGGALAINTVLAASLGGLLPLMLQAFRVDPAVASGPILTTVTDMCGFFFVLSFATAALPYLV